MNLADLATGASAAGPGAAADAALIRRLTCFDPLTGLPNRLLFREQLDLLLRVTRRQGGSAAVLLADIDDFRQIKNSLGHRQTDRVLKIIAARISGCLRDSDVVAGGMPLDSTLSVARLGGAEFAIFLSALNEPHDARRVAERLREAVGALVAIDQREVFPTLSIGVAVYPGDAGEPDSLIECADIALSQAKARGRNRLQFYNAAMSTLAADRLELESRLRRAIAQREFRPVFQPRVDARTGSVFGMEALLRWHHPERGEISPSTFIDVAEQSRLIVPIGEMMLEAACRQNVAWQQAGLPAVPVSVNVSAAQVAMGDFASTVERVLERTGLSPASLELEITESLLMNDAGGALQTFRAIRAMGVGIAIDDFGTGFSSLAYLRDFPFDVLKIDRSFVRGLPGDARTAALACSIIDLARRLGLQVVAEGVETQQECDFLLDNGCALMQGYRFSRPRERESFESYWRGCP